MSKVEYSLCPCVVLSANFSILYYVNTNMDALVQKIISDSGDEFSKNIIVFQENVSLNALKIFIKNS